MRKVYILPNLFTAASLFCGMLAIFEVFNAGEDSNLVNACWLIVAASILDVFDGTVARLTRTQSSFGLHFDSLSDLVAFGVAPAVLAYGVAPAVLTNSATADTDPRLMEAVCCLFVVFGALRLARFNVQAQKTEKKTFTGLPIPAAALAVSSLVWLMQVHPALSGRMAQIGLPLSVILPFIVIVIAFLMVSNVRFYGLKSIRMARREPFEILVIAVLIAGMLFLLRAHLDIVLFTGMWGYLLGSVFFALFCRRSAAVVEIGPGTSSSGTSEHK